MRAYGLPELLLLALIAAAVVVLARGLGAWRHTGSGGFNVIWAGAVVGAVVGFFLRPSLPLIGQLPLHVVITRGASLRGLDTILKGAAETSFNYMVVGAVVGGVFMTLLVKSGARPAAGAPPDQDASAPPVARGGFCTNCGAPLAPAARFCSACGAPRN